MLKLGILDFDSSHSVEFTSRLNHCHEDKEQWVDGARVVIGCPGESLLSPERIPGHADAMRQMNVPLVERPADMIGKVDGMLITSIDGSVHWERARPFLEAGIPCFIDKPFACSLADARKLADLAAKKNLPIFSASGLRYALEIVEFLKRTKNILGVMTYGHAPLNPHNPGLFHYGIHAIEGLHALMGPGCQSVTCTTNADVDAVTGVWQDGRVASMRGTRQGVYGFGAVVFLEDDTVLFPIEVEFVYRELLKKIVEMFETGKSPLDIAITLEIIALIEAAGRSASNGGAAERVSI